MRVYALDFDGVVCDSAGETAASAWRAGATLWPEWAATSEPGPELVQRFREFRPFLETGWQAVGLLRLAATSQRPATDFTPAEVLAAIERIYAAAGCSRETMVKCFGETRDRWIAVDPGDWLARHRFYPGMAELLREWIVAGQPLFIISTKQERFIRQLLAGAGVELPAANLFGLERQRRKGEILAELLARPEHAGAELWFVEDRLETLLEVVDRPELDGVRLLLADWGYNLPAERRRAAGEPRLQVVGLEQLRRLAAGGTDGDGR